MKENSLVSNYTIVQYKVHEKGYSELTTLDIANRKLDNRNKLEVVVSNLTYIKVGDK